MISSTSWVVPNAFCCPITREIMANPVLAADGHTYDRDSIEYWLSSHSTSPVTNAELSSNTVTTNHTVHTLIEQHRQRLGEELLQSIRTITNKQVLHLLENGANMNVKTADGNALIMEAVRNQRLDIVKVLVSKGVDVACGKNDQGEDLMSLAKQLSLDEAEAMVELLAPVVQLAIETKMAEEEARRLAALENSTSTNTANGNGVGENQGLLPGFPQVINGWNIGAGVGFFPSLFALLFHNFMETSNELPTANQTKMHNALTKFTIGVLIVAAMVVILL